MSRFDWKTAWSGLTEGGWRLERKQLFRPMFGRYWRVRAGHEETGRAHTVEAPTLNIALKKLAVVIERAED